MKKVLLAVFALVFMASVVYAGGDQCRGEKGLGEVEQGELGQGVVEQLQQGIVSDEQE